MFSVRNARVTEGPTASIHNSKGIRILIEPIGNNLKIIMDILDSSKIAVLNRKKL